MSRGKRVVEFYSSPKEQRLQKSAADTATFRNAAISIYEPNLYTGPKVVNTAVVRVDLNGYGKWAQDKALHKRVELLDDFFTHVITRLKAMGGIYYRDEGDCIVALFSTYFPNGSVSDASTFCKSVVSRKYGPDGLTAKAVYSTDNVAYFQKAHENGTSDWSAEGRPFVTAARLEAAVPSEAAVFTPAEEYDIYHGVHQTWAVAGQIYYWIVHREKLQVAGLGISAGGWMDIVKTEYLPGGRSD